MPSRTMPSRRTWSKGAVPPCISRRSRTGGRLVTVWPVPLITSCAHTCMPPRGPRLGKGEEPMDPSVKNPQAAANPGPYGEGDRVRLLWGVTPVEGIIIEDRGNLGVGARRLYRVRVQLDDITEPIETSLPVEDLTRVAKAPLRSRNG